MKRLIKQPLKALWRWTGIVRRPFVRKAEAFLARSYAQAPIPHPHVHVACNCRVNEDTGVLMDFLVRELVRLQDQVVRLQTTIEERTTAGGGFQVVGGSESDGPRVTSVAS
jgi:hypothetical protein